MLKKIRLYEGGLDMSTKTTLLKMLCFDFVTLKCVTHFAVL